MSSKNNALHTKKRFVVVPFLAKLQCYASLVKKKKTLDNNPFSEKGKFLMHTTNAIFQETQFLKLSLLFKIYQHGLIPRLYKELE